MNDLQVAVMKNIEFSYKNTTGLVDRSQYKIFYGKLKPVDVLLLGVNPGGDPNKTSKDGAWQNSGERASASDSFYESDESDIVDCVWKENIGIMKLLMPLYGGVAKIREKVGKTNLVFRRSPSIKVFSKYHSVDIGAARKEAVPFLNDMMKVFDPRVIIISGESIDGFTGQYGVEVGEKTERVIASNINQTVYESRLIKLCSTNHLALAVRVAHASQFSWTYERFDVNDRIKSDLSRYSLGEL